MDKSNGQTLGVSLAMLSIAILAIVIPFMTSTKQSLHIKKQPLVLRTEDEIALLKGDRDRNGTEDWKDLILGSLSTTTKLAAQNMVVDDATRARLSDPNNITASFAKNLSTASAVIAKKSSTSNNEGGVVLASLLTKETTKLQIKTITAEDITIAANDTSEAKRRYGNAMALLLNEANKYGLGGSDQDILQKYSATKDASLLETFITKKENVEKITTKLLALEVPTSAAVYHIELINAANSYAVLLDGFAKTESDPIRSLIALDSYVPVLQRLFISMDNIRKYFLVENTPFTVTDPGYIFIQERRD